MDMTGTAPAEIKAALEAQSTCVEVPCANGSLPVRRWNVGGGERVVLVHGGSGSWTHWIRNIEVLARSYEVIAPDSPGLGDAASLPDGYTAEDAAGWLGRGLASVVGDAPCHLVGFSWGCTLAALIASARHLTLSSLVLVGSAALGDLPRRSQMKPLIRRTPGMSDAEIAAANRENLARLMIHNRDRIDELAVFLQTDNTRRARFNSPQFARSTLVLDALAGTTVPLLSIYGEYDAPAYPDVESRGVRIRGVRPDTRFRIIPGAGHWVQYECADEFNTLLVDWLSRSFLTG